MHEEGPVCDDAGANDGHCGLNLAPYLRCCDVIFSVVRE